MEEKLSIFQKYYQWSKERFPAVGVLLYAGSIYYVSLFFGKALNADADICINIIKTFPGLLVVFLVLLHLRIFDEHKDYEDDKAAYPDRILSKGLITLADLRLLLYPVIIIEAALSLFIGVDQFVIWLAIAAWSLLMLFEFFIPEFLNRHMGLYLVTHQLLVPFILLLGFSQFYSVSKINAGNAHYILLFLVGAMFSTMTYEISRKTWSEDREHKHADSYTSVWGIGKTIIINQLLALAATSIFIYLYNELHRGMIYSIILASLYGLFLFSEILFYIDPVNKKSKIVEAGGILFMLGLFINSSAAFF